MSACMRCLYSSDHRAFGLTAGLLGGRATGCGLASGALRAPALSLSVTRAPGEPDEEFGLSMK